MSVLADTCLSHKAYYSKNCKGEFFDWGDPTSNFICDLNSFLPFAASVIQ